MTARSYDDNGWFEIADNPISREGVFPYSSAQIGGPEMGKIYQVFRPAEELGADDALASFRLLPIIDDHTMLGEGGEAAEDVGVAGVIGENLRVVDGVLLANLKIFSNTLAEKIKNGKTQLSCGYRCFYDFTPGEWNGQAYDAVQRQIRGNHLALVDEGRMGPQVAILDQMTFTVDAKEQKPAMDEDIKQMLAAIVARLDKLESHEAAEAEAGSDETTAAEAEAPPVEDAETGTTEAEVSPEAAKEAAGSTAMDSMRAQVAALSKRVAALDEGAIVRALNRKNDLASRLSVHVGVFDHARMTHADVVAYGVKKLGLVDIPAGSEAIALDAALQVRAVATPFNATDSKRESSLAASLKSYTGKA